MDKETIIISAVAAGGLLLSKMVKNKPDYQPATTGGVIGKKSDQELTDKFDVESRIEQFEQFELDLASELNVEVADIEGAFTIDMSDNDDKPEISFNPEKLDLSNTSNFSDKLTVGASYGAGMIVNTINKTLSGLANTLSPINTTKTISTFFDKMLDAISLTRKQAQNRIDNRQNPMHTAQEYREYDIDWTLNELFMPDFEYSAGGLSGGIGGGDYRGSEEEAASDGTTGWG